MSTCVLVETGEEDPVVSVATLVSGLIGDSSDKLAAECGALLEAGKFADAMGKIMAHGAKLFADASDKDLEAAVLILGGTAQRLPGADAAACLETLVAEALASTERGAMRATLLFQLYNMQADAAARLATLTKILAFVKQAKLGALVDPLARHVEENYTTWNLDAKATRALLRDIFTMLSETHGAVDPNGAAATRVLELRLKYLNTFAAGEALDAAGEEVATAAVVSFIQAKDMMFRCDILGYPAVQALKGTKSAPVLELLSTLLTADGVDAFAAFAKKNGALFKQLGLDEVECAGKMKLLALCGLAESAVGSGGQVTYAQVAAALSCGEGEVEGWIVRAIGARLVEAKMDQVRGVAVVTRVTHRVFGEQQWKDLAASVESWRENLAGVGQAIAKSVATGNATLTKEAVAV
jgi:translation initiation factor 3 subunit M